MDEAERVAHRIAILDHGELIAEGTAADLKAQTDTDSLESAFLALTVPLSAMRAQAPTSRCGKLPNAREWPMNAIYILWLRELSVIALARTDYLLSGATDLLLVGFRFRFGPVSRRQGREYCSSWRRVWWDDGAPKLDVSGSPCSGIANLDSSRKLGCAGGRNLSHIGRTLGEQPSA